MHEYAVVCFVGPRDVPLLFPCEMLVLLISKDFGANPRWKH